MTTTKKKYVKPEITVIEVDAQQMICMSPGGAPEYEEYSIDNGETYNEPFM